MGIASTLCFQLARTQLHARRQKAAQQKQSSAEVAKDRAYSDSGAYQQWRDTELHETFSRYFSSSDVKDCDVVDFGCGEGGLCFLLATLGVKSITGIDLSEPAIRSAQGRVHQQHTPVSPTFILAKSTTTIDLPSASTDVLLCFDVLEHIMGYKTVIPEWKRVLRKNGRVLIAWTPWYNPYAHHLEYMIPVPWAHVLFSDKTLIDTCARIYDLPEWTPAEWDMDANGNKKPNKSKNISHLSALNRLTMQQFESECRRAGLAIVRKQITGFSSPTAARFTHLLLRVPRLQEFFTSMVGYTLKNLHA